MASLPPEVLYGPAYAPPDNTIPNFDDPPNQNVLGLTVIVLCLTFATLCAIFRAYSRIVVVKKIHIEDYLGLVGYAMFVACSWSVIDVLQRIGLFVRQWNVQVIDYSHVLYDFYILQMLYCFAMLFIKTAILQEWVRIFVPQKTHNRFFWIARGIMVANALLYIAAIFVSNLACMPREKMWQFWLPGKCVNKRTLDLCTSSFNLCFDLCILMLPQKVIWNLQMNIKRKIGVSIIFSVGILACVGAAGRVASTAMTDYYGESTYGLSSVALFGLMEMTCVVMVFCIPAIPKIFIDSTLLPRIASSIRSWTRIPLTTRSLPKASPNSSKEVVSWPHNTHKMGPSTPYMRPNDNSQEALTEPEQPRRSPYHSADRILKVTEFSTGEVSHGNTSAEAYMHRQHPWVESHPQH